MLDAWLSEAAAEAGVGGVDADLFGPEAVDLLLDLAKEAAHGVARPGAPLATFAVGLALGRSGGGLADLTEAAARVVAAARRHGDPPGISGRTGRR